MYYDTRHSWFRLFISLIIGTIGNVGMWGIIIIMPSIETEFGINRNSSSVPYAMTMVGFAFGNIIFGKFLDKYGIVFVLILGSIICSCSYFFSTIANSILVFSIIHFFLGLGSSASFGPLIADISMWFKKRRGIAVSIVACGNYLSGAIWPLVMSEPLSVNGWRYVYIFFSILMFVVLFSAMFFLRKKISNIKLDNDNTFLNKNLNNYISDKKLIFFLSIAGLGCCVAMSMPQVHLVSYCVDLGYGAMAGSQMLSLMLFGGTLSRLLFGFITDKIGGLKTLFIGSSLQCFALFFYMPFDGLISLYIVSLIFGLSQGGIIPSYAIIIREYTTSKEVGTKIGFVIMITIFGMALGGWMSGKIFDLFESYHIAFLNGILWNLINISIVIYLLILFSEKIKTKILR